MKSFFFLLSFILCVVFTKAQTTELEKKYGEDACNCLTEKGAKNELNQENFMSCFQEAVTANKDLIEKEVMRLYGDTSYFSGLLFGQELNNKVLVDLINQCDTYYHLIDTLRYVAYKALNKDSLEKRMIVLNGETNSDSLSNIKFLTERAHTAFILGKHQMALVDLHEILLKDTASPKAISMKAWIYELNKEYDASLIWCDKLLAINDHLSFKIIREMVKRKQRESKKD